MKICIRRPFFLSALIAGVVLMAVGRGAAQTFKTLHTFTPVDPTTGTNSDGGRPSGPLVLFGNTLYGAAYMDGNLGPGTMSSVFRVNTNGTSFSTLYSYSRLEAATLTPLFITPFTNSTGADPDGLILSSNTFYGTTQGGGTGGDGTIFTLKTDGNDFTNLHNFAAYVGQESVQGSWASNLDGALPNGSLILSTNTLYGTASRGGVSDNGTVFKVNTDGTGFTTLHQCSPASGPLFTNSDGTGPNGIVIGGQSLFGTAGGGGPSGSGIVFRLNTDGSDFIVLHSFSANHTDATGWYTNGDGVAPTAALILAGNTLYGMTGTGGTGGGTLFKINTDGTGFTNFYWFSPTFDTNSDGAWPIGMILVGNTLYGTTSGGGGSGTGTIFAVTTNGTGFTVLHTFTGTDDGEFPNSGLGLAGDTLYGTTEHGLGMGTVFSLSFPPQLTITPSGTNMILTWPTNYLSFDFTGYILQSTTNLDAPMWTANSAAPVVVDGQYTVTNPISRTRQFLRLSR